MDQRCETMRLSALCPSHPSMTGYASPSPLPRAEPRGPRNRGNTYAIKTPGWQRSVPAKDIKDELALAWLRYGDNPNEV